MNTVAARASDPPHRHWPGVAGALCLIVLLIAGVCEYFGWPFLVMPMQRWLSGQIHRPVDLTVDGQVPASVVLRLLRGIRIDAPRVEVGAGAGQPYRVVARDVSLAMGHGDAWRALQGGAVRIQLQHAREIDVLADSAAAPLAGWECRAEVESSTLKCSGLSVGAAMAPGIVLTPPTWFDDVTKLLHNRPQSYMPSERKP